MFEAKLTEGLVLKKIVDSIKDIVTDVNIDISPSGKSPARSILSLIRLLLCVADLIRKNHEY